MAEQPLQPPQEGDELWFGLVGPIHVSNAPPQADDAFVAAGRVAQAAHSLADLSDLVLSHPDALVRCEGIPRIRARFPQEPTTLQVLVAASRDPDDRVRDAAVMALGNLGGSAAADAVAARLADVDFDVRLSAAQTLAYLGDPRAPADPEAWALQTVIDGTAPAEV